MWSSGEWRTFVGIIGNIISGFLFLSPIPTLMKICKARSVQAYKADPYVVTIFNCATWVYYGLPFVTHNNILVVTINGVGLVIEGIYVAIFIAFSTWGKRRKIIIMLFVEAVAMLVIILITLLAFHKIEKRGMVVGIIAIILNVCMYASPLTVMRQVIRTKSVKYMPFWLSVANFANGLVWFGYAFFTMDYYLLIPNGLGAISGLIQLILFAWYYKSTNTEDTSSDDEDATKESYEIQLSDNTAKA